MTEETTRNKHLNLHLNQEQHENPNLKFYFDIEISSYTVGTVALGLSTGS